MVLAEVIGTVCGATAPVLGYGYWTWSYYGPRIRRYLAEKSLRRTERKIAKLEARAAQAKTSVIPEEVFKSEADVVADLDTAMREADAYDPPLVPHKKTGKKLNPKQQRKKAKAKAQRKGPLPAEPFVAAPKEVHASATTTDIEVLPAKVRILGVIWRSMRMVTRPWDCVSCGKMIRPQERAYRGVKGKQNRQRMCVSCACSKGVEIR